MLFREKGGAMPEVSREELLRTIADFIEMGHVANIVAMFKQDLSYYELVGELVRDERFMVRMGMAVLFEELAAVRSAAELNLAVAPLQELLTDETPYVRGEAATLLAIINTPESLEALQVLQGDPDPQVAEIVTDALSGRG